MLSSATLARYGSCIKYLAITQNINFKEDTFAAVNSLHELLIIAWDGKTINYAFKSSMNLITANRGIQTLDLQFLDLNGTLSVIARACPALRRLRLVRSSFALSDLARIFGSCRFLYYLLLQSNTISRSEKDTRLFQDEPPICDLQELHLRSYYDDEVLPLSELLSGFPRLKSILLTNVKFESGSDLRLDCCQELTKIVIAKYQSTFDISI